MLLAVIVSFLISNGCCLNLHKNLYTNLEDRGKNAIFVSKIVDKLSIDRRERFKRTLTDENNKTDVITDDHQYYTSTYFSVNRHDFIDLTQNKISSLSVQKINSLTSGYLIGTKVNLPFNFTFYGNRVNSIYITTGGFLSVYPDFHSFIHSVHYIAPLMADFNLKLNKNSAVYFGQGVDMFIVQWDNVLTDDPNLSNETFTFQVIIYQNGSFLMIYQKIPYPVYKIKNVDHPVTAGIADGYIISLTQNSSRFNFAVYHSFVYKYHEVKLPLEKLKSFSAYRLDPVKTCLEFTSCESCTSSHISFQCKWCPELNLCSDAINWNRQIWLSSKCSISSFSSISKCSLIPSSSNIKIEVKKRRNIARANVVGIVFGVIFCVLILVLIAIFAHAYLHPQTRLGMWIIEYRPSRWFLKKTHEFNEELLT
ncbi:plexin domain-containing protein 2 [Hydra vulgaris]|uniref:plexin domain-containing protein 2 n=1 Tax=Hydra vulgaris TaxID=6087 RepID=UPI001F5F91B8|nr:plexin domain-containing protein 2-like [Hydra vulgaris]